MQYMILTYETAEAFAARDSEQQAAYWGAWRAYGLAMREAGILKGGHALQPATTGTTLRTVGGKTRIQDGPFADSKEQLGGYYIIDVAQLDVALEWAARCPAAAAGVVEVRPIVPLG